MSSSAGQKFCGRDEQLGHDEQLGQVERLGQDEQPKDAQSINEQLTVNEALKSASFALSEAGDEHPDLSARWILAFLIDTDPGQLDLYMDKLLSKDLLARLEFLLERRAAGEPLQYICEHAPFRRLDLIARFGVFIPRPETEILVQVVLDYLDHLAKNKANPRVLDLCCGSGAISVSIASEAPNVQVIAVDISMAACELSLDNAKKAGVSDRLKVLCGDLLEPVCGQDSFDVLVSNPPYVPRDKFESMPKEVLDWEPELALDGGLDGLDVFKRILDGAECLLNPGALLAFELDEDSLERAAEVAREYSWIEVDSVQIVKDLAGRNRILVARRCVE